jgi:hypothetical protein
MAVLGRLRVAVRGTNAVPLYFPAVRSLHVAAVVAAIARAGAAVVASTRAAPAALGFRAARGITIAVKAAERRTLLVARKRPATAGAALVDAIVAAEAVLQFETFSAAVFIAVLNNALRLVALSV